jgi:uncharacterized protein YjiS (DUF1127 family)
MTVTTATHLPSTTNKPAAALLRAVRFIVGRVVALLQVIKHRREVRTLLELDDRALQDIGLVRNDVMGALAHPVMKDPSIVLLVRSVERRSRVRARALPPRRVSEPVRAEEPC